MSAYYVNNNAQSTGEHEVHTSDCQFFYAIQNKTFVGNFNNCHEAIRAAKAIYSNVDGCYFCCNGCHKK